MKERSRTSYELNRSLSSAGRGGGVGGGGGGGDEGGARDPRKENMAFWACSYTQTRQFLSEELGRVIYFTNSTSCTLLDKKQTL